MYKLVVCDIDNTLVPKHKQPSERTIACIRQFPKRGILFGLASGRGTDMLRDLANEWGIHCDILIGNNGGEYQDEITGEHDILDKFSCEDLHEIFKIMEPFKEQTNCQMFINGKRYIRRMDEQTAQAIKYTNDAEKPIIVTDESIFWSEPAYKVGFRTPADLMPEVEKHAEKLSVGKSFKSLKTEFTMYEFARKEADKGKMLVRFCKSHDIDIKDAIAFGDMTNDITLLKEAGWGVCLENGSPDCKAVADEITELSIEDDGWADYVEKHILNS